MQILGRITITQSKPMQLSCYNINVVPGKEICPRCSTQISDVLKNPEYTKMISMDSPEISLSYQANFADETISSMDVESFDNRFTQVKNTRILNFVI